MRSIDNLREYALTAASVNATTRAVLAGYVDEIEREVEELRDCDYRNGVEDGEMAAERDGWVRLPVDADGVPIHVGDVMELAGGDVEKVESLHNYGSEGWSATTTHNAAVIPWSTRHHHAPTVEDVLEEFTDEVWNRCCEGATASDSGIDELVAEYAAKLRLAGEDE